MAVNNIKIQNNKTTTLSNEIKNLKVIIININANNLSNAAQNHLQEMLTNTNKLPLKLNMRGFSQICMKIIFALQHFMYEINNTVNNEQYTSVYQSISKQLLRICIGYIHLILSNNKIDFNKQYIEHYNYNHNKNYIKQELIVNLKSVTKLIHSAQKNALPDINKTNLNNLLKTMKNFEHGILNDRLPEVVKYGFSVGSMIKQLLLDNSINTGQINQIANKYLKTLFEFFSLQ